MSPGKRCPQKNASRKIVSLKIVPGKIASPPLPPGKVPLENYHHHPVNFCEFFLISNLYFLFFFSLIFNFYGNFRP